MDHTCNSSQDVKSKLATICSNCKWIDKLFFELSCGTDTHTDGHECSIYADDKPHLYM